MSLNPRPGAGFSDDRGVDRKAHAPFVCHIGGASLILDAMTRSEPAGSSSVEPHSLFLTTRWSVVLAAKDKASPGSTEALETLCRAYWHPLYAFIRGLGHPPEAAQDLTQEFFARFLAKDYLQAVGAHVIGRSAGPARTGVCRRRQGF